MMTSLRLVMPPKMKNSAMTKRRNSGASTAETSASTGPPLFAHFVFMFSNRFRSVRDQTSLRVAFSPRSADGAIQRS